jgi:hypothetical protein
MTELIKENVLEDFHEWYSSLVRSPQYKRDWYYDIEYFSPSMQHGVFLQYIREKRGVHIRPYRNGSGWLWNMEMSDSGTDLGWSGFIGDCPDSRTFTTHDKALENAIVLEMNYGCYHSLCKNKKAVGHWGNYARHLRELSSKDQGSGFNPLSHKQTK